MKKLLLALLLTTNVLAMSEGKTDASMDSICLHKGTLADMEMIDQLLEEKDTTEESVEQTTQDRN